MRILGVDPGLKSTGYGVIDIIHQNRPKLVEAGSIDPRQQEQLPQRLDIIYQGLSTIVKDHRPHILVLEKLYAHYKYTTTASILGHARGVICLVCAQHQLLFVEMSVKRVRKAVVGNGNASKKQTQNTVGHILNIDASQLTLDASDALALALGHAAMRGFK